MKLLKCEVCGSSELTKNSDGLFICDFCGAKYTLEAVQTMLKDNKIDISGSSISIDKSSQLRSFVQAAADACAGLLYDDAARYAQQALDINPNNPDALFVMALYFRSVGDENKYNNYCFRANKYPSESLGLVT
ncbi:MAG: hypothetical protein E7Z64_03320 [Thermoplasmata archaeon]|jgi:hypothetical protein|nr:hypothetical protein [Thermoplasmata archaeon]